MKNISLRNRLVVGLVGIVLVGLVAANSVTYLVVKSFLLDRVDEQLAQSADPALDRLGRRPDGSLMIPNGEGVVRPGGRTEPGRDPRGSGGGPSAFVPPGTYGELRSADGTVANVVFTLDTSYAPPDLPDAIQVENGAARLFTVGAKGDSFSYRVRAVGLPDGSTLVTASPLIGVDQTLSDLRLTGFAVSAGVIIVLAISAFWLVRLGLRPLDEISVAAGEIAGGNLTRRIEIGGPKTEVGRLGESLNRMLSSLEHAFAEQRASEERLRRFLADASHELRTPLTSIRGYAELFQRGASKDPQDLAKVLRRVDEESARMSVLVEDLLLLARLNQGRPLERQRVDLAQLARDAVDDALVVAPARSIRLNAPAGVFVDGDEGRLRQVIHNLVNNALHHTPEDAAIDVVVAEAAANTAVLKVADQGPGLSPEDAAHVFEPFYRIDRGRVRAKGGTGLGLAIVRAIVEAHGGEVGIEPNEPVGSVFVVRVPTSRL